MLKFLLYCLTLLMIASSGCSNRVDPALGVLTGVVTKGPTSPMQVTEAPAYSAAGGVRLNIVSEDGKLVASVQTDPAGHYRVSLPPGPYRITMESKSAAMFSKDLPARVMITAGEQKQFDIQLDTGIR